MKRINLIFDTVKSLDNGAGVTTSEISTKLNLERSNISKDLNLLVKNNKLFKKISRPVKYFINNPYINKKNINNSKIDELSSLYPSLKSSITLAKTAIMYPPIGMNSIIIGDTGVGKSMLAKLMHDYACDFKGKNIPYIHFNCSDYATNPQLLVSHLFGVKKGTFTGATVDKTGLIEKANEGIVFLDEIHNLPSEGQEMLFLYMDTGKFRRFGEVYEQRNSSAMIICATNKDINSSLLATFTRRIPIKINLPSLKERNLHERLTIIEIFLKEESSKIDKDIFISQNSIYALISYDCPNNIGQLKNDITLSVANSYFEYIVHNKKCIKINSMDLPSHVNDNINLDAQDKESIQKTLNKLDFNSDDYMLYNKNTKILKHNNIKIKDDIIFTFANSIITFFNIGKNKIEEHTRNSLGAYIDTLLKITPKYSFKLNDNAFEKLLTKINDYNIEINDKNKFQLIFKIHIDMIYDRIGILSMDIASLLIKLKNLYPQIYKSTELIYSDVEDIYNVSLSDIEFLSIFLILNYFK